MGANKISPRENRLSPKITTKGSHTSSPRSCSHDGPTNPRNKSQRKPKRKHNSKREELRQFAVHRANRRQEGGGVDCSQGPGGPSEGRAWTVHDGPADRPPRHGPSYTLVRTVRELLAIKINQLNESNQRHARTSEEHNEHLVSRLLADRL
jgi:hypothetical protein